jgi:hypothetical protein
LASVAVAAQHVAMTHRDIASWQGTSDFPWLSTDRLDTSRFDAIGQFVTTIID